MLWETKHSQVPFKLSISMTLYAHHEGIQDTTSK